MNSKNIALSWIFSVALLSIWMLFVPSEAAPGEDIVMMSAVGGLDFKTVIFSVSTSPEYYSQLSQRALTRLKNARLVPRSAPRAPFPQDDPAPELTLTLWPEPIPSSPGIVLYSRKIELYEDVVPMRSPSIKAWAPTWFYGVRGPIVRGPITIEELEADLDGLIDQFISEYRRWGIPESK